MHAFIEKISGGFAGTTHYQLMVILPLAESAYNDEVNQEKEARINAQKILDERFPEAKINAEEIFITERFHF